MTEFHEGLEKNDPVWVKRVLGDVEKVNTAWSGFMRDIERELAAYFLRLHDDVQPEFVVQKEEDSK